MGEYDKQPVQRKAAPTAGPSRDDQYGAGKVGANLDGRIIKADAAGGRTLIVISKGTMDGAHVGMEGYIKGAGGMLADFQIHDVNDRRSYAFVDGATTDDVNRHLYVVINPTTVPRKTITKDEWTRVIGISHDENGTRVTIDRGATHGVTYGMNGTMRAADGHDESFTIVEVTARNSVAILRSTVEHVTTNRNNIVLHPSAPSPRASVQRRASGGATSTSNVDATAQAGVAGATSRLPHFDAIQRSFGKHDISNIQAQVGGAATGASRALGAQAYATGNKVAFASAPDLHTAAHEAAHTIQQARGAVGFQGLGAADDEHERHADAVADAVVAGQSAEPLLDRLSTGSPSMAVQRKPQQQATNTSTIEHSTFVDLLLQQLAEVATRAQLADDSPVLLERAMNAVSRTAQALSAIDSPTDAPVDPERLFVTVDAAYAALNALQTKVAKDVVLATHVPVVASAKAALKDRFERLGWRAPSAGKEQAARARTAAMTGGDTLTSNEALQLALLHVRAARLHMVGGWAGIATGKVEKHVISIRGELREANSHLIDPAYADKASQVRAELVATELVFDRAVMLLERTHPQSLAALAPVAVELDHLRRLIGDEPKWAALVLSPASTRKPPSPSAMQPTPPPHTVPAHAPVDIVGARRVDDLGSTHGGGKHDLAGVGVDPLVGQGGTRCETDSREGCFLDTRHRDVLLHNYQDRVDAAQKEFHAALAELRVDVLIAKEKQEDVSWVASLVLDVLSMFVVGKLANALKVVRASGIRALDSMIADDYSRNLTHDPKWKVAAADLLDKISDKQIDAVVKGGVDQAKKATSKQFEDAGQDTDTSGKDRSSSKGKDVTFLDMFRVHANLGFQRLKVDVAAASNDGELLALYTAFDVAEHQKEPYKNAIEAKLGRFRKSGVKNIGRRYEDAQDGRRVIRDVRVAWHTYASGRPMELVFEHQDGYRPARDQYEKPGPIPIDHEMRDTVKISGKPDKAPKRTFGTNLPMMDEAMPGLSDKSGSANVVPSDLVEVALTFHEQAWGETPRIIHVDDRKARMPSSGK